MTGRLCPRSLQGQLLLAVALALLLAQGIGAALLFSSQIERRSTAFQHTAALRLFAALSEDGGPPLPPPHPHFRAMGIEHLAVSPLKPGERRNAEAERHLRTMLTDQGIPVHDVMVIRRSVLDDAVALRRIAWHEARRPDTPRGRPEALLFAAVQRRQGGAWLATRVLIPPMEMRPIIGLIAQALLTYGLLVGVIAFILRRITRPLAALTGRMEHFTQTRDADSQLVPEGPDDVRRLIVAHNAMEARIAALLDEKDVMLGAIGHDLKTPLAALRVRIESVADDSERAKMAATIEDITRSLDDILSLARVGRPSDPLEPTELSALVAQVVEEFEDMGEPVTLEPGERMVLALRATWLRRAVRNLVSNALRYGRSARLSLTRENGAAVLRVEDDGPGIPDTQIARMMEPFTRGDPSRNSETGGAGLGLTLARAIAEQHGGSLVLANRHGAAGAITGLTATISLPLV